MELGGAVTLMPLHSATASALFTSLLSLHNQSWGCLSEGNYNDCPVLISLPFILYWLVACELLYSSVLFLKLSILLLQLNICAFAF